MARRTFLTCITMEMQNIVSQDVQMGMIHINIQVTQHDR